MPEKEQKIVFGNLQISLDISKFEKFKLEPKLIFNLTKSQTNKHIQCNTNIHTCKTYGFKENN